MITGKMYKHKLYIESLSNNKNKINLLRHTDTETLYQVADECNKYCGGLFAFFNLNRPIGED